MDRFIWIGNHCVNLDCIVRFTLEDEGRRIVVMLRGVPANDATLVMDGAEADRLKAALRCVELGTPEEAGVVVVTPVVGPRNRPEATIAEIDSNPRSSG